MNVPPTLHGSPFDRAIKLVLMTGTLAPFFVAGGWFNPWNDRPNGVSENRIAGTGTRQTIFETYDPYRTPKLEVSTEVEQSIERRPEPRAVAARAEAIASAAAALRAECQQAAGGDWEKWQADTEKYRTKLEAKIRKLTDMANPKELKRNASCEVLEGLNGFPLFEPNSREYLRYLYDADSLDEFRCERPVVAAQRWLQKRGIDLIFVPIPKMTEVYMDHFLDPCPPDGIIAPHVRKTLLDLLEDGVEVVDGLRLFRQVRDVDAEYLYNTCDHHWAPRGMRVMAKEIADRIERYSFGARARYGLPIVKTAPGPYIFRDLAGNVCGYGQQLLMPEQSQRAKPVQTTILSEVTMLDGRKPPDDAHSPVMVIGHSFVPKFREQLIKELNLLTSTRASDHQTTESFADFLREPELLDHCQVIVWISTDGHMARFHPMPEPVMKTLSEEWDHKSGAVKVGKAGS
jgi:hypothetical protein